MSLLPCSSCGRHVRITDASCPFCAAVLPEGRTAVDALLPRAKRAITFVAASVAVAACSNTPDSQVTPDSTATATATATAGGDTQPTATATATATATQTATATTTASALPSAAPSASAVASASSKPPVAPPTFTSPPTKPTGPQTRYGLPPYLAEDEIV